MVQQETAVILAQRFQPLQQAAGTASQQQQHIAAESGKEGFDEPLAGTQDGHLFTQLVLKGVVFVVEHLQRVEGQHYTFPGQPGELFEKGILQGLGLAAGGLHVAHCPRLVQCGQCLAALLKRPPAQYVDDAPDQPLRAVDIYFIEIDRLLAHAAGGHGVCQRPPLALLQYGFQHRCLADAALALQVDEVDTATTHAPFCLPQEVMASDQRYAARAREFHQPHSCLPLSARVLPLPLWVVLPFPRPKLPVRPIAGSYKFRLARWVHNGSNGVQCPPVQTTTAHWIHAINSLELPSSYFTTSILSCQAQICVSIQKSLDFYACQASGRIYTCPAP